MSDPHYSGDLSREFWRRVNALPARDQQEVYSLGCMLQGVEAWTLQRLDYAEKMHARAKGKRRARGAA